MHVSAPLAVRTEIHSAWGRQQVDWPLLRGQCGSLHSGQNKQGITYIVRATSNCLLATPKLSLWVTFASLTQQQLVPAPTPQAPPAFTTCNPQQWHPHHSKLAKPNVSAMIPWKATTASTKHKCHRLHHGLGQGLHYCSLAPDISPAYHWFRPSPQAFDECKTCQIEFQNAIHSFPDRDSAPHAKGKRTFTQHWKIIPWWISIWDHQIWVGRRPRFARGSRGQQQPQEIVMFTISGTDSRNSLDRKSTSCLQVHKLCHTCTSPYVTEHAAYVCLHHMYTCVILILSQVRGPLQCFLFEYFQVHIHSDQLTA